MEDNPILTAALSVAAEHYRISKEDLKKTLQPGPGKDKAVIIEARGAFIYMVTMYGLSIAAAARFIDLNRGNAATYKKKFLDASKFVIQARLMSRVAARIQMAKSPKS